MAVDVERLLTRAREPKVQIIAVLLGVAVLIAIAVLRSAPDDDRAAAPLPVGKGMTARAMESVPLAAPQLVIRALGRAGCAAGVPNLIEAELREHRDAMALITIEDLSTRKGTRALAVRRITVDPRSPRNLGEVAIDVAQLPEHHALGVYLCTASAQKRSTCRTKPLRDLDLMANALPGSLRGVPGGLDDKVYYFQMLYRVGSTIRFIRSDTDLRAFDFTAVSAQIRAETGLDAKGVHKMVRLYRSLPLPVLEPAESTSTRVALQLPLPVRQDAVCRAMRDQVALESARARSPTTRTPRPPIVVQGVPRVRFDFNGPASPAH